MVANKSPRSINDIVAKLQKFVAFKEYRIVQCNGQRIYEPAEELQVPPPPRGSEIFIGNLPKSAFEDELIPLFETIGPLYKFRLMLDFSERNRGYAFATYFNPKHADDAIARLNRFKLVNGSAIGVYKSVDNRRLFVGNIPQHLTRREIIEFFENNVQGVVDVIVYKDSSRYGMNRGFAFLEFESHLMASTTRRVLYPRNLIGWDRSLFVDWADPLPHVTISEMNKVTVLYIKNIPFHYTSQEVHAIFSGLLEPHSIRKTCKINSYAFVHFRNRHSAEIGYRTLTGFKIGDDQIEVEWARPRSYSTKFRESKIPENFCVSVPLHSRRLVKELANSRKSCSPNSSEFGSSTDSISPYWENDDSVMAQSSRMQLYPL